VIPDSASLALFAVAALALVVVPGPAVLYVVAQSIGGGRRAGLVSMLGIEAGALVHVTAAAVGLSSLLVSSATAFEAVKYAGAAYLVVLGIRRLLARDERIEAGAAPAANPRRRLFAQGVVVSILNPKTALFFFAFLPQFVDPNAAHAAVQMVVLGLVFVAIAAVSDSAYARAAGSAAARLRAAWAARAQRYVSASVFIGLGLTAAFSGSRRAA